MPKRVNGTPVIPGTQEDAGTSKTQAERQREYRVRLRMKKLYPNLCRQFEIRAALRKSHPAAIEQKRAANRSRANARGRARRRLPGVVGNGVVVSRPAPQQTSNPNVKRVSVTGKEPLIQDVARYAGVGTLERLAKLSLTDRDIAEVLGVSPSQLRNWKRRHPSIRESLKKGRTLADSNVVESLYRQAVGYTVPDRKIHVNGDGKVTVVETEKYYPPNPVAAFYWLKNRQGELWKDKKEVETTGAGIVAKEVKFVVVAPQQDKSKPDKIIDGDFKILPRPDKTV